MAYELKKSEKGEKGEVGANGQKTPVIGASQTTLAAGDGQKGTAPKAPIAQKKTPEQGGLTDIGRYLDINQQKTRDLAEQTAGLIGKEQTQAEEAITGAGTKFKQDVGAGTVNLDQNYFNQAREALTGSGSNLNQFLSSQAPQFSKYYNATYGGPQDIVSQQYYANAAKEAQQAQQAAEFARTAEGRKELLARLRAGKTGRYTRGGLNLDQALIAGDEQAIQSIQQQADAVDAAAKLDALRQMAKEEVARGQSITQGTRSAFQNEFNIGREEQEIADRAQQIRSAQEAAYNAQVNAAREKYGVQEGINISDFIANSPYSNISKYNVGSESDYARLKALQDLTGQMSTFTPYAAQAGQYQNYTDQSSAIDLGGYEQAVSSARQARLAEEERQRAYAAAQEEARRRAAEAADAQKEQALYQTGGTVAGAVAGTYIGGPVGGVIGGAVGGAIGGAIGSICFDPNTPVTMADGTTKKFKQISLHDDLAYGGRVYATYQFKNNNDLYEYPSIHGKILVTADHAVEENGRFIRVKKSKKAVKAEQNIPFVCSLSCENHRIFIDGIVFADYDEVDAPEGKTNEECLKELNGK